MHLSGNEFRALPHKAITLLGMSGVGKTHLASKLPKTSWFHYSGDYRIGTKYLEEPILDNIKQQAMQVDFLRDLLRSDSIYIASNITVHNLEPVSTFLGKVGNPAKGGLPLEKFRERQRMHLAAEVEAMKDVAGFIHKAQEIYGYDHFVNDAGGSLCELEDPEALRVLSENTVIVYIRAGEDMEAKLIQRARDDPKPMYYRRDFLDEKLKQFMETEGLSVVEEIDPDQFASWIFPELVRHRRPRYQGIADRFGYTIDASDAEQVRDEADFIELLSSTMDEARISSTA